MFWHSGNDLNELQRDVFNKKDLRSQPMAGAPSQRNAAAAATLTQGTASISKFEYLNQSVRLEYLNNLWLLYRRCYSFLSFINTQLRISQWVVLV
jgi:hypothetical protein